MKTVPKFIAQEIFFLLHSSWLPVAIGSILLFVFFLSPDACSQPQKLSYQAVIRNVSNGLVVSTQIGMKISILKDASPVYIETHTPTTDANGLATIEIGGGTPVTNTFASIDWSTGTYNIKTETAVAAPLTTYTIEATSQLMSVPYALYAKSAGTSDELQNLIDMFRKSSAAGGTITDADNNVYNTVKIGTQYWMSENLKTTKYNDGTAITNVTGNAAWTALTTGAFVWYNNDETTYKETYGAMYNWYAVDNNASTKVASNGGKNICPTGWHVPTDTEWTTLITYLGGGTVAGGKLKETGTTHWKTPNMGTSNENGFTALPGGSRVVDGTYYEIGSFGYWWSSTATSDWEAKYSYIFHNATDVYNYYFNKPAGMSVRCLRD